MALANPALSPQKFQQAIDEEQQPGWAAPGGAASSATAAAAAPAVAGTARDGSGLRPPMGEVTGKTMTYGGTFTATLVLFVVLLATGAWGWGGVTQIPGVTNPVTGQTTYQIAVPGWLWPVAIVAMAIALVTIFVPKLARVTGVLYAATEGAVLGAISAMYNAQFQGIVLQAVLATLSVFAVMLFLYVTRLIKVTRRFQMTIIAAMGGILVLYLGTMLASLFGLDITFWNEPSPLGIGISVLIVGVAAFSLMLDFAFMEAAVQARAPRYMEWYAAFGLMVGLVWLYLEILRLLALLRSR